MTTKLKIDLKAGQLEVEGSEDFVERLYADFISALRISPPAPSTTDSVSSTVPMDESHPIQSSPAPNKPTRKQQQAKSNGQPKTKSKSRKDPEFLKDLDLSGGGSQPSLKSFFSRYEHKTNYERNLIFTYYLKQVMNLETVTPDHIFTCYRHCGQKIPKALEQGLRDTANDRGWLDVDNMDDIRTPIAGINHIEHDMPKTEE